MFRHHFKIAVRNILKQRAYSLLNLLGLAAGMVCALLILLYVQDELSYDRFHTKIDRLYRLDFAGMMGETDLTTSESGPGTARIVAKDFPEVEAAVRLRRSGGAFVAYKDQEFKERWAFADSQFFDLFTFPLIQGNPQTALVAPNSVVISASMAKKYFNDENPLDKMLSIDGGDATYQVTGVMEDIPSTSHFHFDFVASMTSISSSNDTEWLSFYLTTYLLLKEGTRAENLEAKFPDMVAKYVGPEVEMYTKMSLEELKKGGNYFSYHLFPVKDIHLHSNKSGDLEPSGNMSYVLLFSIIGLFILLIACINFMNLATARSLGRAREVGVKKVVGAQRGQLITQFLVEAITLSLAAMGVAVLGAYFALPFFNELTGKEIVASGELLGKWLPVILGFGVLTGLLAGSYPAFFLSAFRPVSVLRGKLGKMSGGKRFRSALVVFQFVTTVTLLIGTFVVYSQLQYIQQKKLGFNKDHVLIINDAYLLENQIHAFNQQLKQHPQVINTTISSYLPVTSSRTGNAMFPGRQPEQDKMQVMQFWSVDYDYIETMGISMKEGRNFSKDFGTDSLAVIINETAARQLGWPNAIGEEVSTFNGETEGEYATYKVVGVIEDFHFASFRTHIEPMILFLDHSPGKISVRFQAADLEAFLAGMQQEWDSFDTGHALSYSFLDEKFASMYQAEQRTGQIISFFAGLAILIACLGLFGLAAFTAEQRTKEIGIRKVLGASFSHILWLLSRDFALLILIAFALAIPLAYYVMYQWLGGFEYHTSLGVAPFVFTGFLIFGIAALSVSLQSIKAALTLPVKALKQE